MLLLIMFESISRHGVLVAAALVFGVGCASTQPLTSASSAKRRIVEAWDLDSDGLLTQAEAPRLWELLDLTEPIDRDGLASLLLEDRETEEGEVEELFREVDADEDGAISEAEFEGSGAPMPFHEVDLDGDEAITRDEVLVAMSGGPDEDPDAIVAEIFDELAPGAEDLLVDDLPDDFTDLEEADLDGDGRLTRGELLSLFEAEFSSATFEVRGGLAIMKGVIGPTTPRRLLELILAHPKLETIEFSQVPGSMDDEANLLAGRILRRAELATHVSENGSIASGGVDLYLAGIRRSLGKNARVGVHSWGGGSVPATELPRDDPQHRLYLDYYAEIGTDPEFYWFTLSAAPQDAIHWMTDTELVRFRVETRSSSTPGEEW